MIIEDDNKISAKAIKLKDFFIFSTPYEAI